MMNTARLLSLLVAFPLALAFGDEGAPKPKDDTPFAPLIEQLEAQLPELLASDRSPGLAIALTDGHRIVWSHGYGSTRRDGGVPVTPKTRFSLQSASKAFTGVAAVIAAREGRLSLDAPLPSLLPELRAKSVFEAHPERRMSVRQLLDHTAGFASEAPRGNNYTLGEVSFVEHLGSIDETWLRHPVGEQQTYSNLGIALAGRALERATGTRFATYVEKTILKPLGLESATYDAELIARDKERAIGHSPRHDVVPPVPVALAPAGGVYASAEDLARFLSVLMDVPGEELLLDEAARAELFQLPFASEGQVEGFGLGVELKRFGPLRVTMLPGRGFGFVGGGVVFHLPERELGVAVLANDEDSQAPMQVLFAIAGALMDEAAGGPTAPMPAPVSGERSALPAALAGSYRAQEGALTLGITENGARLLRAGAPETYALGYVPSSAALVDAASGIPLFRVVELGNDRPVMLRELATGASYCLDHGGAEKARTAPPRCQRYVREYFKTQWGRPEAPIPVTLKDGGLFVGGHRVHERRRGLFFDCQGHTYDFTQTPPRFGNIPVQRVESTRSQGEK